jgi:hypothetical protein
MMSGKEYASIGNWGTLREPEDLRYGPPIANVISLVCVGARIGDNVRGDVGLPTRTCSAYQLLDHE